MRKFTLLIVVCFSVAVYGVFARPVDAAESNSDIPVAEEWIWPLILWDEPSVGHGDLFGEQFHMGIDAGSLVGAGGEVIASADGIVREVEERSQFGLVILIEHQLADGQRIVSLYGHLRPGAARVEVGDQVNIGQVIGVLGNAKENGGWSPHIHFGIHKEAYTGEWKYYGHVNKRKTRKEWYDPEQFIPKRFAKDIWSPHVSITGLRKNGTVKAGKLNTAVRIADIGEGVSSVRVELKHPDGVDTLYTAHSVVAYPLKLRTKLNEGYQDGRFALRITATDASGQTTKKIMRFWKAEHAKTTPHITTLGTGKKTRISTVNQNGKVDDEPVLLSKYSAERVDMDTGFVNTANEKDLVSVQTNAAGAAVVRVTNSEVALQSKFVAYAANQEEGARVATGDVTGDGIDEIIVASAPGTTSRIRVFTAEGKQLWQKKAYKRVHTAGVDVAAGNLDADSKEEIVASARTGAESRVAVIDDTKKRTKVFRAFEKEYTEGTHIAIGDINGNGTNAILVGSTGERLSHIRLFNAQGKKVQKAIQPFGKRTTVPFEMAISDWDNDGTDELTVARFMNGMLRVITHDLAYKHSRVFQENIDSSTRAIAVW